MPSVTNWTVEPGRGQPSGTSWVTTKAGTSNGCWPSQPSATSNVRRPVSIAPTSAINPLTWSALGAETRNVMSDRLLGMGISTSPEKYQSKTSATPSLVSATYPSRDMDMIATTLDMVQLLSGPPRTRGCGACGLSLVLQTRLPPGSHRCPVKLWPRTRQLPMA
jgi:hypothetical protein